MVAQDDKNVKPWQKNDPIKHLASDVLQPEPNTIRLSGPPSDTAKAFIVSQMFAPLFHLAPKRGGSKQNRAIFWLAKDDKEAKSIYDNLKFWQGINKSEIEILLIEPGNSYQLSVISYRLSKSKPPLNPILEKAGKTSESSSTNPLLTKEGTKEEVLLVVSNAENLQFLNLNQPVSRLIKNQKLNPQTIASQLADFGYERNTIADSPGTFAIRGEIVDIWTPQLKTPVRIATEFNQIAAIKTFDPITKKTTHQLYEVDIIPLAWKQDNQEIKKLEIEKLETRNYVKSSRAGYGIFNENATFILSDPDEITLTQFPGTPKIVFESLSAINNEQLTITSAPTYHNNLAKFASDLKKYQKKNYQIIIATNREKSLKQLFQEKNINPSNYSITQLLNYLITGFKSELSKFLLLTDFEIFGREEIKSESKPANIKQPIFSINAGDYVVHEDHGIAVFKGTAKQKVDDIEREYFLLEYAGGDKLYVPAELANKIEKYIGLANPHLHRLSGGLWYLARKKIKEQTEKIAKELLDLYAQRELAAATPFGPTTPEEKELLSSFPYEETSDQLRTINEIERDLGQKEPMDRLVCGDVGFGKTEVAIRAAFKAVMNNSQVALIAPTTILAQQHYDTFKQRLEKFPVTIEVLSRFRTKAQIKKTVGDIKNGVVDITIGTHRLLSADINFKNLGLIIIDEEQRFGVEHKEKLKKMRTQAHILTLTATPIPRTLHFSLTGLRDISLIETPPPGRKEIKTIIKQYDEETIKKAIELELERNGQVYFVHNKVETIRIAAHHLQKIFTDISCASTRVPTFGIAHGQMPENELSQVMADFDNRKIDILVCSTIIENGLDLPNVNTLIVDEATKFGLSQLYQLRGRVGRSDRQAYAYFFYRRLQPDSVQTQNLAVETQDFASVQRPLRDKEIKRLQALQESEKLGSGFNLAMRDLEIRGIGDILGKKQHGAVAAIGLSLYTRLLAQAVSELKTGVKTPELREISVDLPLEIMIPKEIEPNEMKRLHLYQQLAGISEISELEKNRELIKKKYPRLIREKFNALDNLFAALEIKLLCQKTDISSIDTSFGLSDDGERERKITVKFKNNADPELFLKLLNFNQNWKFSGNQIKIMISDLGQEWVRELKKSIKIFQK